MPSSEPSSSSDREQTPQPSQKTTNKGKKKSVTIATDGKGKNEGPDPNWEYKPPNGFTLLQDTTDAGEFDWDALANDDDTELWLIRVPESVKPRYLENTTLKTLKSSKKSSRMATLVRKHATFDIWSIGEDDNNNDDADAKVGGGEEIKTLSCLLPRKSKKGKLYPAPKPIARHLVVSAQAAVPTPDPASTGPGPTQIQPYTRPPRENYPKDVLTHPFRPYGSLSVEMADETKMDVDVPLSSSPTLQKKAKRERAKEKVEKTKDEMDVGVGVASPVQQKKVKRANEKMEKTKNEMDVDVAPPSSSPVQQKKVKRANEKMEKTKDEMDVDVAPPSSSPVQQKKAKRAKEESIETEKTKGKKRKGEGVEASSEKKLKKVKTS